MKRNIRLRNAWMALVLCGMLCGGLFTAVAKTMDADHIYAVHKGMAQFEKDGKRGLMDSAGNIILPAEYDSILWSGDYIKIRTGERYGLLNSYGKMIAEPVWEEISIFNHSDMMIICKDGKYGFLSKTENGMLPLKWKSAQPFHEGFAAVEADTGLYGYIDMSGTFAIEPKFLSAGSFSEGLACVKSGEDVYHVINHKGQIIFDSPGYVGEFVNGLAMFGDGIQMGWVDREGNIVAEPYFYQDATTGYDGENISFWGWEWGENLRQGFFDLSGNVIIPPQGLKDPYAAHYSEGLVVMMVEDRLWRCFNAEGALMFELEADWIEPFSEGKFAVQIEDENGLTVRYVDRNGKALTESRPTEEWIKASFSEGLAIFYEGGKVGYMNHLWEVVIPAQYRSGRPFQNGLAEVSFFDGKKFHINMRGEAVN